METLAFIHASAAYDDLGPEPEVRSFEEVKGAVAKSAVYGLTGSAIALTSVVAVAPDADATLRRGDNCSAVRLAQGALLNEGFNPGGLDGRFGSSTESAVRSFQRSEGLSADGVIGPSTARALSLSPSIACGTDGTPSPGRVRVSTSGSALNARTGPGTNFRVERQYANGTILNTTGRTRNGFTELTNGLWVSSNFVRRVGDNGGETPSPGRIRVSTNGGSLNARTGPSTSNRVERQYANGTVLNITGRTRNGFTELTNGLWVSSQWVNRL